MAQKTATFETGATGYTVLASDAGSASPWDDVEITGDASIVYSNINTYGTLSAKVNGGTGNICGLHWNMSMPARHYGRCYLFPTTIQGDRFILPFHTVNGACASISVNTSSGNRFDLNDAAGATADFTSETLVVGQWTRLEWMFLMSPTVGQIELKIFSGENADGDTPNEVVTTAANLSLGVAQPNLFIFGNQDASTGVTYWDNIVAGATAYPGPYPDRVSQILTMGELGTGRI